MKHRKGGDDTEMEEEEHTISVISNLFQGLSRGSRRDRVAAKFVENEFEKCDRLMELYNRYKVKVVSEQVSSFEYASVMLMQELCVTFDSKFLHSDHKSSVS